MYLELALGAAVAFIMSLIACRAQIGAGPIDAPDIARKAHGAPTPTGGGVGIAAGFAGGLMALSLLFSDWRQDVSSHGALLLMYVSTFAYAFMVIGFADDIRPLGAISKFIVFSFASLAAVYLIGAVTELPLGAGLVLVPGPIWGLVGTALWVFTLVNCINFMDGANGLAMGSVAIALVALAAIAHALGSPSGAAIGLCGAGALIGFLVWNFPGGRLFAGDSGSLFAGALGALGSLLVIKRTGLSPLIPPVLFFPLLADALLTLIWRASRGRSLLDGHSEHLYQIALRAGWSHARVALIYWAAMALCGTLGAALATVQSTIAPAAVLAALVLAAVLISTHVRRAALRRGIAEI